MKKVLIITYYWPPSGGAGVQRWLKFVKYLHEFGWTAVVYTAQNPETPYTDETLLKDVPPNIEVIRQPIFEPYQWYNRFTGERKNTKFNHGFLKESNKSDNSITKKIALWVRGNLFIPDARVFWIKPSVTYLSKYLNENPIDLIVSSGPPHSLHLIAKKLKKRFHLPWVADFRDPWTGIYYFEKLMLSALARKRHHLLEQSCFDNADCLITVGRTMKNDFAKRTSTPIEVITNGFDESDFLVEKLPNPKKFRIVYTGMFLPDQNPQELWEVLGEMTQENIDFNDQLELVFVGKTDARIVRDIEANGLIRHFQQIDYVAHEQLPEIQQTAAVLLLCINRIENASYILTGKVFEYLASQKPILAFCPDNSDVAEIIRETNSGKNIAFGQKTELKLLLSDMFQRYRKNELSIDQTSIQAYSRKALTHKLALLFDKMVAHKQIY